MPVANRVLVEKQIVLVQIDRHAKRALGLGHPGDVIDVRMRQQDVRDLQFLRANEREQLVDLVARIDEHGLAGIVRSRRRSHS